MSSDPMTPLESLLRAAEALADDVRRFFPTCGGEKLTALDAALARYRATPPPAEKTDLEERVAKLEAIEADRRKSRDEWFMEELERRHREMYARFSGEDYDDTFTVKPRSVMEAVTASEVTARTARAAARTNEQGAGIGVEEPGSSPGLEAPETRVQIPTTGPAPASPPAFARETPREWNRAQKDAALSVLLAAYPYNNRDGSVRGVSARESEILPVLAEIAPLFADIGTNGPTTPNIDGSPSPPPETRTDVDVEGIVKWLLGRSATPGATPIQAETAIRRKLAEFIKPIAVPPAQPPKRETGIDREAIGRAIQNAERRAVGWAPLSDDERPSPSDMMHADAALALVSEHVARVERERDEMWCRAATMTLSVKEIAKLTGAFNILRAAPVLESVVPSQQRCSACERTRLGNEEGCPWCERDTLKAECERLRAALDEIGQIVPPDAMSVAPILAVRVRDMKHSLATALARADAAERKLSECEEDNSAWRTEAFEQRVRAQNAEKRLATAAPRAPAEGIEKAKAMDPLLDALWKVFGPTYRSHRLDFDTVVHYHVNKHWPSPATPGPIVMPEREALALAIITAYDAEQGEEYDPSTEAHLDDAWLAEADAALSAFRAANDGATFEQEGT